MKLLAIIAACGLGTLSWLGVDAGHEANRVPTFEATDQRFALVIGNAAYAHFKPLNNPANDAAAIERTLKRVDFDVLSRSNVTLTEFREAVRELAAKTSEARVRVVYYSGHAVQVSGENYLLPVDAPDVRASEIANVAISLSDILRELRATTDFATARSRAELNVVILDACRDNPLRSADKPQESGFLAAGLAPPKDAPAGTIIAFSTAPGSTAADGLGKLSPYTEALAQYMAEPGLTLSNTFIKVRNAVIQTTAGRQVPWEHTSGRGDVVLRPAPAPEPVSWAIAAADDRVMIYVNQRIVLESTGATDWLTMDPAWLKDGANSVTIKVYNKNSRRFNNPFQAREGWRYHVRLKIGARECSFAGSSGPNVPDEQWGHDFIVATPTLNFESSTGNVTLTGAGCS